MKGERLKIGIIGASASGIYSALLLALSGRGYEIHLFDHADKIGKKVLATGNGHCNFLHRPFSPQAYNDPSFVESLWKNVGEEKLQQYLDALGIESLVKGELVYPLSYNAAAFVRHLGNLLAKNGVRVSLNEEVKDVDGGRVVTDSGVHDFDIVIFAFGGKSQSNLGSDGSLFSVLGKRGYHITPLSPGLCPLRCADVPKSLAGVRHGALVTLEGGKALYQEDGEVLFKKDGISGIAVMNASLHFQPGTRLHLDLFPSISKAELAEKLARSLSQNGDDFLVPFAEKPLAEFLANKAKNAAKTPSISEKSMQFASLMKDLIFHPIERYGFAESQVTCGGVDLANVNEHLQSAIDPRHYFVGECLDIHGYCGGHNLGFALLSAIVVSEAIA